MRLLKYVLILLLLTPGTAWSLGGSNGVVVADGKINLSYHPLFGAGEWGSVDFSPSNTSCVNNNDTGCPALLGCASCANTGGGYPCVCTINKDSSFYSGDVKGSAVRSWTSLTVSTNAVIKMDSTNLPNGADAAGGTLILQVTGDANIAGKIDTSGAGQAGYTSSGNSAASNGNIGLRTACATYGTKGFNGGAAAGDGGDCTNFTWDVGNPLPPLWGAAGGKGPCTGTAVSNLSLGFDTGNTTLKYGGGGGGGGGAGCSGTNTGGVCADKGDGGGGIILLVRGALTISGTLDSSGESAAGTIGGGGGGGSQLIVYGSISDSGTYTTSGGAGSGTITSCVASGAGGDGNTVKVAHGLNS